MRWRRRWVMLFDRGGPYYGFFLAAWVSPGSSSVSRPALPHDRPGRVARPPRSGALDRRVRHGRDRPPPGPADGPAPRVPLSAFPPPWAPGCRSASRSARPGDGRPDGGQATGPHRRRRGDRHRPSAGRPRRRGAQGSPTSSSTPARSSTAGSPRSWSGASSTGRSWCRGSSSTSSSRSPTARTRSAGTAAGEGWRSSPGCRRAADPGGDRRGRRARDRRGGCQARRAGQAPQRAILTNDFNLNRVAELQGVRVLNINSLANAVKPAVLPGEELRVRVIQEGKEAGAGRRLPRRRDDDRGRGRCAVRRQGGQRRGHPRPPDRGRADDLRPATTGLRGGRGGGPAAGRGDGVVVAAGCAGADGRPRQARCPDRRPAAPRLDLAALAGAPEVGRIVVVGPPGG